MGKRTGLLVCTAAALLLTACGSSDDTGDEEAAAADQADDGWTYVDGSGRETALDAVPERIVMHGNAAAALIPLGIRPVGIYADQPIEDDLALSRLDLDGIEIVGEEWGIINVEAVAALQPDLIVAEWWPLEEAYSGLEEGTGAASQQLREIAPIVGPAQGPSIHTMIQDYEELATSLGVDLDATDLAADRERFEAAQAEFEAAVAAQPDLSVLAVSPTPESLYVAVPKHAAELADFAAWGLDLVVPDTPDDGYEYWETLSWENADKYQADLIIVDERTYPANVEDAERQPSWSFLKAAAADAVAVWPAYWLRNYADYAAALEELTTAVESADPNLVS
jgi:iron complex transport system substrate-binding protein